MVDDMYGLYRSPRLQYQAQLLAQQSHSRDRVPAIAYDVLSVDQFELALKICIFSLADVAFIARRLLRLVQKPILMLTLIVSIIRRSNTCLHAPDSPLAVLNLANWSLRRLYVLQNTGGEPYRGDQPHECLLGSRSRQKAYGQTIGHNADQMAGYNNEGLISANTLHWRHST